jgi:hypothetical protein
MPDTGIGAELQRMRFGADLGNTLAKIGGMIREGKLSDQAQQTLADMTGIDLSTDEGIKKLREGVFKLSSLEEPGQTALSAVQQGIIQPFNLQEAARQKRYQQFKIESEPVEKQIAQREQDKRAGVLVAEGDAALSQTLQNLKQKYPEFAANVPALSPSNVKSPLMDKPIGSKFVTMVNGNPTVHQQWQRPDGTTYTQPLGVARPQATSGMTTVDWEGMLGDWTKSGLEFLATLPKPLQNVVSTLGEGKGDISKLTSFMRGAERQKTLAYVRQAYPDYDATLFERRFDTTKSFANGVDAKNVTSLNTLTQHLVSLKDAVDKLDPADNKLMNTLRAGWIQQVSGDARIQNLKTATEAVAGELSQVFKGTAGTDQEIAAWKETLAQSSTKEQFEGAIKTAVELMKSRLNVLTEKWNSGMGGAGSFRILYPESIMKLHKLGVDVGDIKMDVGTKQEPQKDVEESKVLNGKTYIKKNGQWYEQR